MPETNVMHGHTNVMHGHTNVMHGHTNVMHGHTNVMHGHTRQNNASLTLSADQQLQQNFKSLAQFFVISRRFTRPHRRSSSTDCCEAAQTD